MKGQFIPGHKALSFLAKIHINVSPEYMKILTDIITFSKITRASLDFLAFKNVYRLWADVISNKNMSNSNRCLGLHALLKAREIKVAQSMCIKVMNDKKEDMGVRQTAVSILGDLLTISPTVHGIEKLIHFDDSTSQDEELYHGDIVDTLGDVRSVIEDLEHILEYRV